VKQRTRTAIVSTVGALVVVALTTAGVVTVRGGLEERRNAEVLAASDSVMVPATATVTSAAGRTDWTQMPVRFDTAEGAHVKTMVWTRHMRVRFDAGDTVEVEYVAGHPSAARLVGQEGGPSRSWRTIAAGVGILAGAIVLVSAWTWEAVSGRRRRSGRSRRTA
jgi:hypothetical protein